MSAIDWDFRPDLSFGTRRHPPRNPKWLEALHPMFMRGNYLPEMDGVELARIQIRSTTFDVCAIYAAPDGERIRYEVVDEYDGETLLGPSRLRSKRPLTLRRLVDFMLNAWPLIGVLEMNFPGNIREGLAFFTAESDIYPDFGRACRYRVLEASNECKKLEAKCTSRDEIERLIIEIMEQQERSRIR